MVEAILWDNDGVLVDTEYLFFESTRGTLAGVGIELSLEQFVELAMRQGRSAFKLGAERGWAEQQIAELKRERESLFRNVTKADAGAAGRYGNLKDPVWPDAYGSGNQLTATTFRGNARGA